MEFNSSLVWFDSSKIKRSLSFEEVLLFDVALGVVVQLTILDFGWFSGGEIVFGFLLDVRVVLVESSSCEEDSESDSTLFLSVVSLRFKLRKFFFSSASPFFRDSLVIPFLPSWSGLLPRQVSMTRHLGVLGVWELL